MTLERFTDGVARRLAGHPEPERDQIPFDDGSDAYRAAIAAESAYDDGTDEDDEDLEAEPESLESFVDRVAKGWAAAATEDEDDATSSLGTDVDWQPALDAWVANLTAADRERIDREGPEATRSDFMEFVERQAGAAQQVAGQAPQDDDGAETQVEGPLPQTGAEFVDWVHANADRIRQQFGMTVPEYLAAMASANQAEWAKIARESGVGLDAKPSYRDLGPRGQTELVKNDLERSFERLRQAGRYIE